MYDYLEGRVAEGGIARLVLDVGGVGYDLAVPLGAPFGEPGAAVRAWTHLVVRDDAHLLYGFPDRGMRELFRALLTVRGVGPAVALAILSGIDRADLLTAIAEGDTAPLRNTKGVGRKTAEQILLDLGDRARDLIAAAEGRDELIPTGRATAGPLEDAVAALISIGFAEREARRNVSRAAKEVDTGDLEGLVRKAIAP